MAEFDIVVRGGTLIDGTGTPGRRQDLGIRDGKVAEIGTALGRGKQELNADGLLVTPGFVDIHTHFDGQVTWDACLSPTCWHGVTTVVFGNCGVGFAPVKPDRHEWLVGLMEGVEDIPGTALHEGITWQWESFPEYLEHLASLDRAVDFAAQVPYAAVRAYVMEERAIEGAATFEDIQKMRSLIGEGISAGAVGLSMNRTLAHRAIDGSMVPGTNAEHDEIVGVASVLGELGKGVLELAPAGVTGDDLNAPAREVAWMRRVAAQTGRPVTYVLVQHDAAPDAWRTILEHASEARAQGVPLYPQIHGRSPMMLMGIGAKLDPLQHCPSYAALKPLTIEARAGRIAADAALRNKLVDELTAARGRWLFPPYTLEKLFPLGAAAPEYEPRRDQSVAAQARARNCAPEVVIVETLIANHGRSLLNIPILNYSAFNHDPVLEMLEHPTTVLGLADGGAHCNAICDGGITTHMLTHWARDRNGARLPVETLVKKMTQDTAAVYGFHDRGVLAEGMRADVNLIDFDNLAQHTPRLVNDLPGGAPRFIQESQGYVATLCAGEVTFQNGEHTGARPGRLIRR